jgi:pilus assembly protein Flp/PilA
MFARINEALLTGLARSKSNDQGQTMAEYGLLLALIALGVIVAATALGGQISTLFTSVKTALTPAA